MSGVEARTAIDVGTIEVSIGSELIIPATFTAGWLDGRTWTSRLADRKAVTVDVVGDGMTLTFPRSSTSGRKVGSEKRWTLYETTDGAEQPVVTGLCRFQDRGAAAPGLELLTFELADGVTLQFDVGGAVGSVNGRRGHVTGLAETTDLAAAVTALKGGAPANGDTLGELHTRLAVIEAIGSLATDAELIAAVVALIGSADTGGDTLGELQALIGARIAASTLNANGDLLTRAAGVPAPITRANLAADAAFTAAFAPIADIRTAAAFGVANPVLAAGRLGIESDTGVAKLGNGATTWSNLTEIDRAGKVLGSVGFTAYTPAGYGSIATIAGLSGLVVPDLAFPVDVEVYIPSCSAATNTSSWAILLYDGAGAAGSGTLHGGERVSPQNFTNQFAKNVHIIKTLPAHTPKQFRVDALRTAGTSNMQIDCNSDIPAFLRYVGR